MKRRNACDSAREIFASMGKYFFLHDFISSGEAFTYLILYHDSPLPGKVYVNDNHALSASQELSMLCGIVFSA